MNFDISNKCLTFLEDKTDRRRHIYQESIIVYQVLGTPYKLQTTIHTSGVVCIKVFGTNFEPEFIQFANVSDFVAWQKSINISIGGGL